MSRIIVKNLPKGMKEEKFKNLFSERGEITDVQLKYTKDGIFRRFGFIGYKTATQAKSSMKHFNGTFIDTSKISVQIAMNLTDDNLPRPWSKYSQRQKIQDKITKEREKESGKKSQDENQPKKTKKKLQLFEELDEDPIFQEFLETHKTRSTVQAWTNDAMVTTQDKKSSKDENKQKDVKYDDDVQSDDEEIFDPIAGKVEETKKEKKSTKPAKDLSDMDYLRSKMVKSDLVQDASEDDAETKDEKKPPSGKKKKKKRKKKNKSAAARGKIPKGEFVIEMRGIPFYCSEKEISEFFAPIEVVAIHIVKNKNGKQLGFARVELKNENDLKEAMTRHKDYMRGRCIEIALYEAVDDFDPSKVKTGDDKPWMKKVAENADENQDERIAETGRLFVRNLAYVCVEDDLEKLFTKFGPLTEVYLPIDSLTKKVKGFAFITYMMPEHAVKAYTNLDGTVFQGRMLHILPAKEKIIDEPNDGDDRESSYKKKKKAKDKALSGSSHNWNSLFIAANAVADAIADKFDTLKSDVLDAEGTNSLAVRMALGETQIVSETRQFLLDNGVSLDSFSQAAAPRSSTVILVKNLPAATLPEELRHVFSKFGELGRILLPPAGVTGIVEFLETNEAKLAFRKLAYTKFQHVPLYLEWAPVGIFTTPAEKKEGIKDELMASDKEQSTTEGKKEDVTEQEDEESSSEDEIEEGCTLFVKNLNFETTETGVIEKFSVCGPVKHVSISKKKDMKQPGKFLSMGYGFVEYKNRESANKALKVLQHCMLDDHQVELKMSNRATVQPKPTSTRKKQVTKKQKSTKILVRNLPFEATRREIQELFSTFGEIKSIRIPKKASGTHRGFGFVDFLTKQDAKRAFSALCHSTHLYGRRLVLEWADTDSDSVDALRKKTAAHFHDDLPNKRLKKSSVMEDLLKTSEVTEDS